MTKKIRLALLALLGFSTACSTVRNGNKTQQPGEEGLQQEQTEPAIRVLYGVRLPPEEVERIRQAEEEARRADSLRTAGQQTPAPESEKQAE